MAPVWFVVEDGAVLFNTGKETAKGRAIRRDPRLVLCVDLEEPPYAFVQVQGTPRSARTPTSWCAAPRRSAGRYMGADRAEEFGRRNGVPGELLVRLQPTKVIAVFDMTA